MTRPSRERAALESYRLLASPDPATRARMLRGLSRRVATGTLPELIVPGPPERLAQPVPRLARHARLLGAAGVGCGLIALCAWLSLASLAPRPSARLQQPSAALAPPQPPPPSAAERATPEESPTAAEPPRTAARRPRAASAKQPQRTKHQTPALAPPTPVPETPPAKPRELDEELRLMRAAYEALRGGRTELAFERLAEHASRFPNGELAESREVTHMLALCQAGSAAAARAEAASFLARAAGSPYAARVRLICREPR